MECAALAQPQATPLPFQTGQIWGGVERDQAWRIINYKTLLDDAVVFWLGGLPAANGAGRIRVPGMARIRRLGIGQGMGVSAGSSRSGKAWNDPAHERLADTIDACEARLGVETRGGV